MNMNMKTIETKPKGPLGTIIEGPEPVLYNVVCHNDMVWGPGEEKKMSRRGKILLAIDASIAVAAGIAAVVYWPGFAVLSVGILAADSYALYRMYHR